MPPEKPSPIRFIGLDLRKHYLIAIGLDASLNRVLGPQRVQLSNLEGWIRRILTPGDAVVLEMTTNTWQVYDELLPHVHSVTVVHPPHVALITRAQVMTGKIAAYQRILARRPARCRRHPAWPRRRPHRAARCSRPHPCSPGWPRRILVRTPGSRPSGSDRC